MSNCKGCHALVKLIDIIRDLNKSISMHVDNHGTKHVEDSIMDVAVRISKKLDCLQETVEQK